MFFSIFFFPVCRDAVDSALSAPQSLGYGDTAKKDKKTDSIKMKILLDLGTEKFSVA